ncbi:MAG: 3-hydroxyacyl-CoA dehydrogenase family protein, partial [Pseudomonadota bacterium]
IGPLQLTDETSLDLALRIATATKDALGENYVESPADALIRTLVNDHNRAGRKAGAGFYAYDDAGKRIGLWTGLADLCLPQATQPGVKSVQDRLIYAQVLEAVRAFEDGVLTTIAEGDVGAILGWGFLPWSGGPFGWLDIRGPARAVAECDALAAIHGARFTPPDLLREIADADSTFYGRFGEN